MSVLNTLPAPIIQMGHVEQLVEMAQNQPYVQQLVAREFAQKTLQALNEKVPEVTVAEPGKKIREREEERGKPDQQAAGQRQTRAEEEREAEEAPGPSKANPWSGHIVSLKI